LQGHQTKILKKKTKKKTTTKKQYHFDVAKVAKTKEKKKSFRK